MANRKTHETRLQLESLERRETPSSLAVHPIPFRGNGRVVLVSETAEPNGSILAHGTIAGRGNPIGTFSGTLDATLSPSHSSVNGTTLFTTGAGFQLELGLSGNYSRPGRVVTPFRGTFTILHGTGPFAHATGGGTVTGMANAAQGTLMLQFSGRVTE